MISSLRATRLGTEKAANTPVAGANDTVIGTTNRYYATPFTIPSTAAIWTFTGFEVLNGTVVNGSWMGHIDRVDANPPSRNASVLLCHTILQAQSGASAVQRTNELSECFVKAGTICGASLVSNSATARFGSTTVGSVNNFRAIAFTQGTLNGSSVAWQAGTEEFYIKIYIKPVE